MLDYLYRIKKKKTGQAVIIYSFFQSINNTFFYAVSLLIKTKRTVPLSAPFPPPFNPSIKYRLER